MLYWCLSCDKILDGDGLALLHNQGYHASGIPKEIYEGEQVWRII